MRFRARLLTVVFLLLMTGLFLARAHRQVRGDGISPPTPSSVGGAASIDSAAQLADTELAPSSAEHSSTSDDATKSAGAGHEPADETSSDSPEQAYWDTGLIEDPDQYASISGRVEDEYGNSVSGADITVAAVGEGSYPADVFSDRKHHFRSTSAADGQYEVTGIAYAGKAVVRAVIDGHAGGTTVQVEPSDVLTDVDIVVYSGPVLRGRVLSPAGAPMPGAVVNALAFVSSNGCFIENLEVGNLAYSDEDGLFELGFKEDGLVSLQITTAEYPKAVFSDVPVGSPDVIELQISEPASLKGHIQWEDGRPAAGVLLIVLRDWRQTNGADAPAQASIPGMSQLIRTEIDDSGDYLFSAIDPGPQFLVRIFQGDDELVIDESIGSLLPGETKVWNRTLGASATIKGRICGVNTRKPLPSATCNWWEKGKESNGAGIVVMALDGSFTQEVPPGAYVFTPTYSAALKPNPWTKEITCASGETYTLELLLPESATLPIRVVDDQGQSVEGASVGLATHTAELSIQIMDRIGKTDAQGRYVCTKITPDTKAWLEISKDGYSRTDTQTYTAAPGEVLPEETIVLHGNCGIEGIALGADGLPLAGVGLGISFEGVGSNRQRGLYTDTDQNGHFLLAEGIPGSNITLRLNTAVSTDAETLTAKVGPIECIAGHIVNLGQVQFMPE